MPDDETNMNSAETVERSQDYIAALEDDASVISDRLKKATDMTTHADLLGALTIALIIERSCDRICDALRYLGEDITNAMP